MEIKLKKLEALLDQKPFQAAKLQDFQGIMIFSFAITTLETYLATIFIKKVMSAEEFKIKYMKAEPALAEKKISLAEVIETYANIDGEIKSQLAQTTFHNLGNVARLFKKVFNVDFVDIERLKELVKKRHNFVHHAGQDPIKGEVKTTFEEIEEAIRLVRKFCIEIDQQMKKA